MGVNNRRHHCAPRRKTNPVDGAGVASQLFYWWLLPVYKHARKQTSKNEEVYEVPKDMDSTLVGNRLESAWTNELLTVMDGGYKYPSLMRAYWKTFGMAIIILILGRLFTETFLFGVVLLVEQLLEASSEREEFDIVCGVGICICLAGYILLHEAWMSWATFTSLQMRSAYISLLYRKILKIDLNNMSCLKVQKLLASANSGISVFDNLGIRLPYVLVGPAVAIVSALILWDYLGPTFLVSLVFVAIMIPAQVFIGKKVSCLMKQASVPTEKRIHILKEYATGIVQIKENCWEDIFMEKVEETRSAEVKILRKTTLLHIFISVAYSQATKLMTLVTISTFVFLNSDFTISKAFLTVCVIQAMRAPLCIFFPQSISKAVNLKVTLENLQRFLLLSECQSVRDKRLRNTEVLYPHISLIDANLKWEKNKSTDNDLSAINISVQVGDLVMVVGQPRAGKSSLLHLMMGEVCALSGVVEVNGRCAFCAQDPWIFPGSIRQNIICGLPYQDERYEVVLNVCDLKVEVDSLIDGDFSNIKDISLSTLQMAKISLARAVYQDADIYLLDDILASMDSDTAKLLFEKCILNFLRQKIIVFVTDQPTFLSQANQILILHQGRMVGCGSLQEINAAGVELHKYIDYDKNPVLEHNIGNELDKFQQDSMLSIDESFDYCRRASSDNKLNDLAYRRAKKEEVLENHKISSTKAMLKFIASGGNICSLTAITIMIICYQTLSFVWDLGFLIWSYSNESLHPEVHTRQILPINFSSKDDYIYLLWAILTVLILLGIATFLCMHKIYTRAGSKLHTQLLATLLYAPLRKLDKNCCKKLLPVFGGDIRVVDELLPTTLLECTQNILTMLGCLILTGLSNYWLFLPTSLFVICAIIVCNLVLPGTIALKMIEVQNRRCLEEHVWGTFENLPSIRAMEAEEFFRQKYSVCQNQHLSALYLLECSTQAIGLWLGLFSVLNITCVIFSFLLLHPEFEPAYFGVALYCNIILSTMVPEAVAYAIKAARQLTSVVSVLEFTSIENESTDNTQWNINIPNDWPQNGEIIASQLSFAFNPSDNLTLQNLTFRINAGEKIGVVGCTGAGKSALIAALLRMAEPSSESRILIDGIDVSCTPLRLLRSRISVVPRFPVIFSGNLRSNLDPRNKFNDNVLWDALEKVGLREVVQALEHGLQTESNSWHIVFSTHQRQLLCLARAIVIENKILILDVALVDINLDSELAMLNIIRTCFIDCTVLVISHRLRSVMRMDRVFVLKAGKLAEIGHPRVLLSKKSSHFYNMVDQTGNVVKEQLINLSKEGFICPQKLEQE